MDSWKSLAVQCYTLVASYDEDEFRTSMERRQNAMTVTVSRRIKMDLDCFVGNVFQLKEFYALEAD